MAHTCTLCHNRAIFACATCHDTGWCRTCSETAHAKEHALQCEPKRKSDEDIGAVAKRAKSSVAQQTHDAAETMASLSISGPQTAASLSPPQTEMRDLRVLGGGSYGTIFLHPDNTTVIKAALDEPESKLDPCAPIHLEYAMQAHIHRAFKRLYTSYGSGGRAREYFKRSTFDTIMSESYLNFVTNDVQNSVLVSNPYAFSDEPRTINGKAYSCSLTMQRLRGLPLPLLMQHAPGVEAAYDPAYLRAYRASGLTVEPMGQLYFATAGYRGIGAKQRPDGTPYLVDDAHPSTGFGLGTESTVLRSILQSGRDGGPRLITPTESYSTDIALLQQLMGFVYGWIFYYAQIFPLDIELALGLYPPGTAGGNATSEYRINVFDFGLCVPNKNTGIMLWAMRAVRWARGIGSRLEVYIERAEREMDDVDIGLVISELQAKDLWKPLTDLFAVRVRSIMERILPHEDMWTKLQTAANDITEIAFRRLISRDVYADLATRGTEYEKGLLVAKELASSLYME